MPVSVSFTRSFYRELWCFHTLSKRRPWTRTWSTAWCWPTGPTGRAWWPWCRLPSWTMRAAPSASRNRYAWMHARAFMNNTPSRLHRRFCSLSQAFVWTLAHTFLVVSLELKVPLSCCFRAVCCCQVKLGHHYTIMMLVSTPRGSKRNLEEHLVNPLSPVGQVTQAEGLAVCARVVLATLCCKLAIVVLNSRTCHAPKDNDCTLHLFRCALSSLFSSFISPFFSP